VNACVIRQARAGDAPGVYYVCLKTGDHGQDAPMRASTWKADVVSSVATLALLGGSRVRTRPFATWPVFGHAEEQRLLATLRSGNWGRLDGPEVEEFERRFAGMHGCRHGIAVASGTVALRIALLASGIAAGDEVIVPPYTFVSTASAVVEANAVPVFADIALDTFNIDPQAVVSAITSRTRAIIPVHFGGHPAEMDELMAIARDHDLIVLEDAAHAHGARYSDRSAGSLGHLASFSFQSSKNLTSGEGGIITTNDEALAESCRSIQNCGRVAGGAWYEHRVIAGNYRLGEFQGAVLNCQLDRLEAQTQARDDNGRYLASRIAAIPGLHPQTRLEACTRHSYHLFLLRIGAEFGAPRRLVLRALEAEGIPCSTGYGYPLPDQPLFRNKAFGPYLSDAAASLDHSEVQCPNAGILCREQCLWLGQNLLLGSREDMDDIALAFEKIYEHRDALADLDLRARR
jgi:dTDP-4-amino-4,6-dideoxygalactose transaminase